MHTIHACSALPRLLFAALVLALLFAQPHTAHAQSDRERATEVVATINGQEVTLNLVGSLINQIPNRFRNQSIEVLYERVLDDVIDTKLAADAARESGLADNPLLNEIAQRAYERVLAEAWISGQLRGRITEDMVKERYEEIIAEIEGDEKPTLEQLEPRILAELSVRIVDGIAANLRDEAKITRKEYKDVVPEDN
ncbi:MAG: SurA N-terminal domain-containing protein [Proteobacteria bacterium]|nr:SurA N-terminal domain-containing protein [Pseudomonadota bacterium]